MIISDVMDELATALDTITGLRVHAFTADTVAAPAAVVRWPESYTFDRTYGRGMDSIVFQVTVLAGKASDRSARNVMCELIDGSGDTSIKEAIESGTYTACHTVQVADVTFEVLTVAGVDYLSGTFNVNVSGPGSA